MENWQGLFLTPILERGLDYYINGHVHHLRYTNQKITASVEGNETYEVEIDPLDPSNYMSCTCPYSAEGYYCKHMAAVLFAYNEELPDTTLDTSDIRKLIDTADEDQLKYFLLTVLTENDYLIARFKQFLSPETVYMEELVQLIEKYEDEYGGHIPYEKTKKFANEIIAFLKTKIPEMIGNDLCLAAFETVNELVDTLNLSDIDNSQGYVGQMMEECYLAWKLILAKASAQEKKIMSDYFIRQLDNIQTIYSEGYIRDILEKNYQESHFKDECFQEEKQQLFQLLTKDEKIDFDLLHQLKGLCTPEEWLIMRDKLLDELMNYANADHFYVDEKQYEHLMAFVSNAQGLAKASHYFELLKESYPEALFQKYEYEIPHLAAVAKNRKHYQKISLYIKEMASLPNSAISAKLLITELKKKYRRKNALIEELEKTERALR
ncbi:MULTISPECIES: SWIM zinc finger family protein [unclassified Enterococcus]|uniref:SWIM zinc finger family protein n=1 Tax=unclassified Enterococcus TaxID=2608891 RepID=UPI0013ECE2AB|nr:MULTISPECIES: SWIM zinc finger family protein [unclassified Enterococcus]